MAISLATAATAQDGPKKRLRAKDAKGGICGGGCKEIARRGFDAEPDLFSSFALLD
jgi:hypothetical protein